MYTKGKFLDNVFNFARRIGLTMKEVEELADLKPGYFQEIAINSEHPSLKTVSAIADILCVTEDRLVQTSCWKSRREENLLERMLSIVMEETKTGSQRWENDLSKAVFEDKKLLDTFHPLIKGEDKNLLNEEYPEYVRVPVYHSLFHPNESVELCGDCFKTHLRQCIVDGEHLGVWLYLMHVERKRRGSDDSRKGYELYLVYGENVDKLCEEDDVDSETLKMLYDIVVESCKNARLDTKTRWMLEEFVLDCKRRRDFEDEEYIDNLRSYENSEFSPYDEIYDDIYDDLPLDELPD